MTLDELLDAYLYGTSDGPFTADNGAVSLRAAAMLREVAGLPGVRDALERALAERGGQ